MADWFIDYITIYIAGATIAAFILSIGFKLYNAKHNKGVTLSDDDIGGVVLGTIFWPAAIPLGAIALVFKWFIDMINHTSTVIVQKMTDKE